MEHMQAQGRERVRGAYLQGGGPGSLVACRGIRSSVVLGRWGLHRKSIGVHIEMEHMQAQGRERVRGAYLQGGLARIQGRRLTTAASHAGGGLSLQTQSADYFSKFTSHALDKLTMRGRGSLLLR